MTKAQITGLEDSFNWFSYIVELHKDEREKKEGSVCWMARLQISVKILGYEFIEKGMRERERELNIPNMNLWKSTNKEI